MLLLETPVLEETVVTGVSFGKRSNAKIEVAEGPDDSLERGVEPEGQGEEKWKPESAQSL